MHKLVLVSLVGAFAVGLAALFLLLGGDRPETDKVDEQTRESVSPVEVKREPTSGTDTMEGLLARGENLECTVTQPQGEGNSEPITGTYFTSNGRMRGDFIVPEMAKGSVSSVIMRDNTLYSWSVIEGESYGIRVDMDRLAVERAAGKVPDTKEPVPLDEPILYDCKTWQNVDGSIFEPPTDVLFRDYADVVNVGMEFGTSYEEPAGTAASCAVCEQVEQGPAREECKAAFKCL